MEGEGCRVKVAGEYEGEKTLRMGKVTVSSVR